MTVCMGERGETSGVMTVWGEWVGDQCVQVSRKTATNVRVCSTARDYEVSEGVWGSANKLPNMLDNY